MDNNQYFICNNYKQCQSILGTHCLNNVPNQFFRIDHKKWYYCDISRLMVTDVPITLFQWKIYKASIKEKE